MMIDRRRVLAIAAGAALPSIGRAFAAPAAANEETISLLQTQTQALMDAIGPGEAAVWARILHDDAVYTVLALKTDPPAITLLRSLAEEYCGRYSLTPEIGYEIRRKPSPTSSSTSPRPEGKRGKEAGPLLEGQQTGRPAKDLRAEAPDVLFAPGSPRYRYIFQRDAAGKITGFAQRREAWDLVWKREAPSG